MDTVRRRRATGSRPSTFAALALWVLAGCGALRATKPEGLPGGDYRSRCDQPLHACLTSFESVCGDGYDVVRAAETRERKGSYPTVRESFTSEAIVRCRTPQSLIGDARERGAAGAGLAPASGAADAAAPQPSTATAPARALRPARPTARASALAIVDRGPRATAGRAADSRPALRPNKNDTDPSPASALPKWTPCNKRSEPRPASFRKDAAPPVGPGERLRRQATCRSIDDKFRNNNAPLPADTLCFDSTSIRWVNELGIGDSPSHTRIP
jgi:hypothetical protein